MKGALRARTLLLLIAWGSCYEEQDFPCAYSDSFIESTSVCDGVVDCANQPGAAISNDNSDEDEKICAAAPALEAQISLTATSVRNTSLFLKWTGVADITAAKTEKLAGFFISWKSELHSFQNRAARHMREFEVQGLMPWTSYTFIVRPFYTASGDTETLYKIGKAAIVQRRTLPAKPEPPQSVSVVSTKQRNVVLQIVEPSVWNSAPLNYHIEWKATGRGRGPHGDMTVVLANINSSTIEKAINVSVPLPGGWEYMLYVSARGQSDYGAPLTSPKIALSVSVPLDTYEVSASPIGPHRAVVSWRTANEHSFYKVTVYTDLGKGLQFQTRRTFDGGMHHFRRHSVVIEGLYSWRYHVISLEGCHLESCEGAVNTTLVTPPKVFPAPSLTHAERTGVDSFEVSWTFETNDVRLFDGFVVRACFTGHKQCFLGHTDDTKFHMSPLHYSDELYVQVRGKFQFVDGINQLGPPATIAIPEYTNLPKLTLRHEGNIYDGLGTCILAWKSSSHVDLLQYWLPDSSKWMDCKSTEQCDVTTQHRSSWLRTSGYMRITHYRKYYGTMSIKVRGCNSHGCGAVHSVSVQAHIPGSALPSAVSVNIEASTTALVRWKTPSFPSPRGALVTWQCPGASNFQYQKMKERGFFDSDCCRHTHLRGLTKPENCVFQVALYQEFGELVYYGTAVEASAT
ncbi:uncharacterized protein LOC144148807 isoform X3 [Haemaphysalis longicornis]